SSAFWTMRSNWRVRGRARVSLKHLSMAPTAMLLLPPMPGSEYVLPVLTMSRLMLGFWTAREVSAPDKNKPPTATPIKTNAVAAIPMSRIFTLPLGSSTFLRGDPQPTLNRRSPGRLREFAASLCEPRSEEHTSELQSRFDLVCRLLLEKKKKIQQNNKIMLFKKKLDLETISLDLTSTENGLLVYYTLYTSTSTQKYESMVDDLLHDMQC